MKKHPSTMSHNACSDKVRIYEPETTRKFHIKKWNVNVGDILFDSLFGEYCIVVDAVVSDDFPYLVLGFFHGHTTLSTCKVYDCDVDTLSKCCYVTIVDNGFVHAGSYVLDRSFDGSTEFYVTKIQVHAKHRAFIIPADFRSTNRVGYWADVDNLVLSRR